MKRMARVAIFTFTTFLFLLSPLSANTELPLFNVQPVNFNLDVVDNSLYPITDISEVNFFGVEWRNTEANTVIADGDSSDIEVVLAVKNFEDSDGGAVPAPGMNETWEITATYTLPLSDVIWGATSDRFSFDTLGFVGVLTFYLGTDMTQKANSSTGQGYDDGTMIAQFSVFNPYPFGPNSTSGGIQKIVSPLDGSRDMLMLYQSGFPGVITSAVDPAAEVTAMIFDSNLDGDIDNNGILGDAPLPTNWQYTAPSPPPVDPPLVFFTEIDGSFRFGTTPREYPGSCRMTGGGNDTNGNIVLGTQATSLDDRYTYGGQVGAPTADPLQPYGEWTHHQQKGVGDRFIFRSGTASAPKDTKILRVFCQDPCWCVNARPAPFKQISWDGTGHFANISDIGLEQLSTICNGNGVLNKGQKKKASTSNGETIEISAGKDGSRHYYRVHVNDLGEPGSGGLVSKGNGKKSTRSQCDLDLTKFPDLESPYSITEEQCADCPDTYQIEIHCTDDPASDVMYSVGAFVEGGNLQIHPPVGDHMTQEEKAACGQ